jgi:hypothetical protein
MKNSFWGRRSFLQRAAGTMGAAFWADDLLDAHPQNVSTNSKPSDLKITDLRTLVIARAPMTCPLIRIDANQGIYGLGEVRDGASKNYALELKSRMLAIAPGRRRLRRGDGAVGPRRKSLQRADLSDARRQVPRPHPLLRRHHRVGRSESIRPTSQGASRPGLHVAQDGSGHRPRRQIFPAR